MRLAPVGIIAVCSFGSVSFAQAPPDVQSGGRAAMLGSPTPVPPAMPPYQSPGSTAANNPLQSPPASAVIPSPNDLYGTAPGCDPCMPDCCTPCGPPGRFWLGADYLLWWTSGSRLPPLITSAAPAAPNFGELGRPGTTVLYGGNTINSGPLSGYQIRGGFWFDDCHKCGLDFSFFDLPTTGTSYRVSSNGTNSAIFRPFFNTATGAQGSEDVAFLADGITGSVGVQTSSSLLGGDINLRKQLCCTDCGCQGYRFDLLAGYRVLSLQESVQINENLTATAPPGNILVQDRFVTNNVFNGFQLGIDGECYRNGWFVGGRALVALGVTSQSVSISGQTVATPPGGPQTVLPGGLLALRTNIGHYTRDPFAVVPTVGLTLGKQITNNIRVSIGYNFMYWSNVLHAANQIDPVVNPYYIPTTGTPLGSPNPARPAFEYHSSGFIIHGLTVGAQLRF